jgi:hypothetical protein
MNVGIAVVGVVYFAADIGVQAYSGKSITEHVFDE